METTIQHWLTSVARAADLPRADSLDVDSDTDTPEAWDRTVEETGVTPEQLAEAVAGHFGLEVAGLTDAAHQAHNLVPGSLARKLCVLPVGYTDRTLEVATADPVSLQAERELGRISDRSVVFRIAPPAAIREAVERTYGIEAAERHTIPAISAEDLGVSRILVVEDDAETRLLLRSTLEEGPFQVVEAEDGETALEILDDSSAIDLVSLDLNLPGMQGLEVLEVIRRRPRTARLPVIVATGYGDPEVEIVLFEAGADDFVVKPVDPRRFLLRVQAVLRRLGRREPERA